VAASGIQGQRHYFSDVAFGAAIGMVTGRTVTIGHGNARFAVSPAAAPSGAGVKFTWVTATARSLACADARALDRRRVFLTR
jgi:hypothetical protein